MKRTAKQERTSEKRGITERLIRSPHAPQRWTDEQWDQWHRVNYGDPLVDLQLTDMDPESVIPGD